MSQEHGEETPLLSPYRGKRLFDVVGGVALSLLTLPLVIVIALASGVLFRANPFFVQERVGVGSRAYRVIKLRSLPLHAPAHVGKYELNGSHDLGLWSRVIRSTHFDELPQLWQVVAGQMSLVGPRPMISSIVAGMDPECVTIRHMVRPGLTGLWQISTDGENLIRQYDQLDVGYVRQATFWIDVKILAVTVVQTLGAPRVDRERLLGWVAQPDGDTYSDSSPARSSLDLFESASRS